ncbi:MAG: hypothetical protein MRECE_18c012 [Mycoplasmataceae bacterium CE_OT135]|nr:MAG: hypothetical protein MRECE_29c012 [Mycoplasmataceae bacterium CE_OT135]KLL03365.1 MAG: hypothetical protein MRECE_18c012 [Mycoplasmataceae bacterium CE_OT135]
MSNGNRIRIATCQTCHFPIYQGELMHQSSMGSHQGTIDTGGVSQDVGGGTFVHGSHGSYRGTSHTDQWVQCQWCINEWHEELAELKAWKWKWGLIIWLPIPILTSITLLVLTKLEVKGFRNPKAGIGSILIMGLFVGLLLSAIVWWIAKMFAPKPDRYRFRSYRR